MTGDAITGVAVLCALAVLVWPPPIRPWPVRRTSVVTPRPRSRMRRPIRGARRTRRREVVTELLRSLQPATTAGVPPAAALSAAAATTARGCADDPGFAAAVLRLGEAAAAGVDLPVEFDRMATEFDIPELSLVGASWSMSDDLGCSLGAATSTAVQLLEAQQERDRAVRIAISGPRATMQLLTGLPVAGIGIAALAGVPPTRLYAGGLGVVALGTGVLLLALGRWWSGRLIRRATRSPGLA